MSCDTSLAHWLLGHGAPPSATVLRAAQLAAYAYSVLPTRNKRRAHLRSDFVASRSRHQQLRSEVLPLLRAWRAANIDVLLFNGFQLSEFMYPRPGARCHDRADVLLLPQQVPSAERIAVELGWSSTWPAPGRFRRGHNAFCLRRPDGTTRIDVHREIIHALLPWQSVQRRITAAVWESSRTRHWAGIDIREPDPVDMVLVGLVLRRCWSAEEWTINPHDVVDFRFIMSRHDVTRDHLLERARSLRCERTLAAFLERCDPDAGRLDLAPLSARQRRRLRWRAFPERGLLGAAESRVARLFAGPLSLPLALRFVPTVMRVRRALRRSTNIPSLLHALCDEESVRQSSMRREAVMAGVRWATQLVGTGPCSEWIVRALATFIELRKRGWQVDFVSGVRRDSPLEVAHAWVECDGDVLTEIDQPDVSGEYEQNFRFSERVIPRVVRGQPLIVPTRLLTGAAVHSTGHKQPG